MVSGGPACGLGEPPLSPGPAVPPIGQGERERKRERERGRERGREKEERERRERETLSPGPAHRSAAHRGHGQGRHPRLHRQLQGGPNAPACVAAWGFLPACPSPLPASRDMPPWRQPGSAARDSRALNSVPEAMVCHLLLCGIMTGPLAAGGGRADRRHPQPTPGAARARRCLPPLPMALNNSPPSPRLAKSTCIAFHFCRIVPARS